MAYQEVDVTGGVDTHKDTHVAAVVDGVGRVLATASFPADGDGYTALAEWMTSFGRLVRVGVEGTGSWGKGLAALLGAAGVEVIEVCRPNRQRRRRHGKNDTVDAINAALAALSGDASGAPKSGDGLVESIRLLRIARNSARRAKTQVSNQIHAVVDTAPESLRAELRGLDVAKMAKTATGYNPADPARPLQAARLALKTLADRWLYLAHEIATLDGHLERLVNAAAPSDLLERTGIGPDVAGALLVAVGDNPDRLDNEASFAALCGVSPIEASSGKRTRHRLNRGGNREANNALWRIALVRLRFDQTTRNYVEQRLAQGKTKKDAIRCLKRYIARDIYRILQRNNHLPTAPTATDPPPPPRQQAT
jgi:transposase